jgi:nucleotide-binding universal stress UspA family protein
MKHFPEKILLATDGLENTAQAARAAADLAKAGGAQLHVVHVWHGVFDGPSDRRLRTRLSDAARETLEDQVRLIEEGGTKVSGAHLREGRTMEEIVEQAEELDAGLIVVGSRRMGRLGRLVMGSVSTGLAHRSSRPVLILGEGTGEWPPRRVLVGYGSFEDTEKAGLLGASIGRALGVGTELIGLVGEADAVETEARLREMERALAARADTIEEAVGERPRTRPLVGETPDAVLDVLAEEGGLSLLSFGSRVLGRAGRVRVGAVLDQVLGDTAGPMLVSPEPYASAGPLERARSGATEAPAMLVATDGSEASARAARYAARLAAGLGAKLFVLYVVDENLLFHSGIHYGEFAERLAREGREATGRGRTLAEEAGVKSEEIVVSGRPAHAILSVAEELGADPVFLGAEGMSKLEHALIGSVSEEVLRLANRTVLVVGGHPEGPDGQPQNP